MLIQELPNFFTYRAIGYPEERKEHVIVTTRNHFRDHGLSILMRVNREVK